MQRWIVLIFLISFNVQAETCNWKDTIPCLTIIPNSNQLDYKIKPSDIITQTQIKKFNLIDLNKVLNFVNGTNAVQSGPIGQQSSLFLRGTNSNHTLVLLNGIPINDFSTPTGAFDFGQDFMYNVSMIQVYKGASASKFGADAIGGAVNIITFVNHQNNIATTDKSISGNYYKNINDWDISIQGGGYKNKDKSALSGGTDKDSINNKSLAINVNKWFNNINFRSTLFTRNTFANIDGHSLDVQDGFSDNNFYALQSGLDYKTKDYTNYITLHTQAYDRQYESDQYKSSNYFFKIGHQANTYGLGLDYKYDESLTEDDDNVSLFANYNYNIFSLGARKDSDNETYSVGLFKSLTDKLDIRANHSTGYKKKTLWTIEEDSKTNEVSLDYSNLTLSLFQSDTGIQNQDGAEISYKKDNFNIFASHLNSKKNGVVQLRRPKWKAGFNHFFNINKFTLITDYSFIGQSYDVHNSNWSTIKMKELHLINFGVEKNGFTIKANNLLNQKFQMPHGFTGEDRQFTLGYNKKF